MARKLQSDGSRLEEHIKSLPALSAVMIQNQTGRNPTKWFKSDVVLENLPYDKLRIRIDGSMIIDFVDVDLGKILVVDCRSKL